MQGGQCKTKCWSPINSNLMSAPRQHITVGFRFKYHASNQTAELASYKHECHIYLILHEARFSFFSFTNSLWTNVRLPLSMYGFRLSNRQASTIVGAVFHSSICSHLSCEVTGVMEPFLGWSLTQSPTHHRATERQTTFHSDFYNNLQCWVVQS